MSHIIGPESGPDEQRIEALKSIMPAADAGQRTTISALNELEATLPKEIQRQARQLADEFRSKQP